MYISENCNWTPYGTNPELDKQVDNDDCNIRSEIAKQGYGLDKLVNDEYWIVRKAVASKGYGLDILANDKSSWVREAVAKQGYGLDILINDEDDRVRGVVADHGYCLDKLINDESIYVREHVVSQRYCLDILVNDKNSWVREAVADQGYGLEILINDKADNVRKAVAKQGYGLDILINDKDWYVQDSAEHYLKFHCLTLKRWIEQNPDKCYYESFRDIIDDINLDNCDKFVYQLIKDNIYLDWIITNITNSSLIDLVTQKLKDLDCSDIQAWKKEYLNNVYYQNR